MSPLLANLLLALLWMALVGSREPVQFLLGLLLGYGVLAIVAPLVGSGAYVLRLPRALAFAGFFLKELLVANLRVARDVVSPRSRRRPGVVAVPLDTRDETEITLLANLLTLTPGTVTLDVADDRSVLYIHAMFVDDPEALRTEIKDGFERRVQELLR